MYVINPQKMAISICNQLYQSPINPTSPQYPL